MKLIIEGNPTPWMRAKRHGSRYFDAQKKKKEAYWLSVISQTNRSEPYLTALRLIIIFHLTIPISWSKKMQQRALKRVYSTTPDLDNLIKFVFDAFNGLLWKDDALIAEVRAMKVYSQNPRTEITIEELECES